MGIWKGFIDIIYPPDVKCEICGDELTEDNRYAICAKCMPRRILEYCSICGRAIAPGNEYCDVCINHKNAFTRARSVFMFEDVRKIIHKFKYGNGRYLKRCMAEFMADLYYEMNLDGGVVTFVPMHVKGKRRRGYNQAELLAKEFAKLVALPVLPTLCKARETPKMSMLGKAERAELIAGSFAPLPDTNIKGKHVILIDDVLTTGATTNECSKILRKMHAGEITVLTFASVKTRQYLIYNNEKVPRKKKMTAVMQARVNKHRRINDKLTAEEKGALSPHGAVEKTYADTVATNEFILSDPPQDASASDKKE